MSSVPAQCEHCGSTVMPWRRYFLYMKITAACQECGEKVQLRKWKALVLVGVLFGAVGIWAFVFVSSLVTSAILLGSLALLAVWIDYLSWKGSRWALVSAVSVDEGTDSEERT